MEGLLLQTKIQSYLLAANEGAPGMPEEVIEEAGEAIKKILRDTFNKTRGTDFRVTMSNLGQPLCKLMMERDKAPKEKHPYSFRMKMLIGDVTEAILRAIIKGSGIKIEATDQRVTLELPEGAKVNGRYDDKLSIAGVSGITDTKSASSWMFKHKWSKGFEGLLKDDPFGYVGQLVGYATADNSKALGWFVVNKENGEVIFVSAKDTPELRKEFLEKAANTVFTLIDPNAKFKRCFEDEPEFFRKQPTGNRKLGTSCSFCDYKFSCWPGLQYRQAVKSEAENAPMVYYSYLDESTIKTRAEKDTARSIKATKKRNAKLS